ncbi:hypothetical protein I79_022601 [Cricetulus griseus]|uniref:Uncharacterized protein n=1 Tax=Cricetulus griseus TaxID=10029 RepID=G3IFS8_CRIGR|nr:hypothetical protein I79_022601 [Cricetulus griseus]
MFPCWPLPVASPVPLITDFTVRLCFKAGLVSPENACRHQTGFKEFKEMTVWSSRKWLSS